MNSSKVEVCDKHYVFDAETNGKFSPAGACPPYQVNAELAAAVAEKQKRDERQYSEYISKGTPTALEDDVSQDVDGFRVIVIVAPKGT